LSSPADLGINSAGDSIGIPNSGSSNNVVFYPIPSPVQVERTTMLETVLVFPNPSHDIIQVILPDAVVDGTLGLYDLAGRLVVVNPANGYAFLLHRSNLPEGIYFVNVKDAQGKSLFRKKVVFESEK